MTLCEIQELPDGTQLLFEGDDVTIFTKQSNGVLANFKEIDIRVLPWQIVDYFKDKWSVKK